MVTRHRQCINWILHIVLLTTKKLKVFFLFFLFVVLVGWIGLCINSKREEGWKEWRAWKVIRSRRYRKSKKIFFIYNFDGIFWRLKFSCNNNQKSCHACMYSWMNDWVMMLMMMSQASAIWTMLFVLVKFCRTELPWTAITTKSSNSSYINRETTKQQGWFFFFFFCELNSLLLWRIMQLFFCTKASASANFFFLFTHQWQKLLFSQVFLCFSCYPSIF